MGRKGGGGGVGYLIKRSAAVLGGNGDSPFSTLGICGVLPLGFDVFLEDMVVASLCEGTCWLKIVEYSAQK